MSSLPRYWYTLRHLKPVQFYGRLWFRLQKPAADLRVAPPIRPIAGPWVTPGRRPASLVGPERFCFLNSTQELGNVGWDSPDIDKLWRYNLHYFDDLNAQDATQRKLWHEALLSRWVGENSPGSGTGWEPYPISLRIVNWVKWAIAGNALAPVCVQSLAVQARYLSRRLEWHLLGNHLFANAKALVFAGLFFVGDEAEKWRRTGLAILTKQIPEQILPDGGQFERSPMYHALALEDLLDLINLHRVFGIEAPAGWEKMAGEMLGWLDTMSHPDGEISLFNDAAFGVAPPPAELHRYADELGLATGHDAGGGFQRLADSGYFRAEVPNAVLIGDVAPVGPDYLPGHAHADTLSFEFSLFGRRLVVNGGTSRYGVGPDREAERGTPAHSTVTVDGENSSEVWSGFRVARRARPFDFCAEESASGIRVSCGHDGYRRLSGRPVHRREWQLSDGSLSVADRIEGGFGRAEARYHFHPTVRCDVDPGGISGRLHLSDAPEVLWAIEGGEVDLEISTYSPEFGLRVPTTCLAISFHAGSEARMSFRWARVAA